MLTDVMTLRSTLLDGFRALLRAERGAVSILVAAASTAVALSGLLSFDIARAHLASSRLQTAVDAATLAATRDIDSPTLAQDIRQVFDANFTPGYLGSTVSRFDMALVNQNGLVQSISLTVEVQIPSPVAAAIEAAGGNFHTLEMRAVTERRTHGAEVALVLDNTGSMYWDNKIGALRDAAGTLLDVLFLGRESVPNLYVSIVPYTARVNIGLQHASWARDPGVNPRKPDAWADYSPATWKGCVLARPAPLDQTDDPPSVQGFDPLFWESVIENGLYGYYYQRKRPNYYYYNGSDTNYWPDLSNNVQESPGHSNPKGPNMNCPHPITPLTASYTVLHDAVLRQVHWWNGGTMANVGLVWGWRTLSPRWRGLWLHEDGSSVAADRPFDLDHPNNDKILVMMTDGNNEWVGMHMTAYGRPDWGIASAAELDDRMLASCDAIKAEGIVVYAITLGTSVSASTAALFSQCASGPNDNPRFLGQKYFHAPTGVELDATFRNIGGQLTELRIVQ